MTVQYHIVKTKIHLHKLHSIVIIQTIFSHLLQLAIANARHPTGTVTRHYVGSFGDTVFIKSFTVVIFTPRALRS